MKKYLLLSIKQEYSERILAGSKTIELRKSKPNVTTGDSAIIYCTKPVGAIVGMATIAEILSLSPLKMWKLHSANLGIGKEDYFNYYKDCEKAIGIVLTDVDKITDHINLRDIRSIIPRFSPPQTYRYFKEFKIGKTKKSLVLALNS